jgi:hypothetical protein
MNGEELKITNVPDWGQATTILNLHNSSHIFQLSFLGFFVHHCRWETNQLLNSYHTAQSQIIFTSICIVTYSLHCTQPLFFLRSGSH